MTRLVLPSALVSTSLDARVLNGVAVQFVATWFSIVGSDTVSKFHRGVMPRDPEADQQFTLVISMLLNTLRTQLATEGIEASIPHLPPDEAMLSAWRDTLALTTLPSPSSCMPTRSSKLSEALFLCSVVCFGNFDYPSTSLLENRGSGGCFRSWCACFTHGPLQHACVQCHLG